MDDYIFYIGIKKKFIKSLGEKAMKILVKIFKLVEVVLFVFASSILVIYAISDIDIHSLSNSLSNNIMIIGAAILVLSYLSANRTEKYIKRYINTRKLNSFDLLPVEFVIIIFAITLYWITYNFSILRYFEYYTGLIIAILEVIILPVVIIPVRIFIRYESKSIVAKTIQSDSVFTDVPIISVNEDELGRKDFIKEVGNGIKSLQFSDPFVYGLYGSWGDGKTSMLNILENDLKNSNNFILFKFEPWNYVGEKDILEAFYSELGKTLKSEYILPGIKHILVSYMRNIISSVHGYEWTRAFLFNENRTLRQTKDEIEYCLAKIGKKLVVFIDDIDRLTKDEILTIFKQVSLSFKLSNTLYILSFDKDVVGHVLRGSATDSDGEINYSGYVDKIVQKHIYLPVIKRIDLLEYFINRIKRLFEVISDDKEEIKIIMQQLQTCRALLSVFVRLKMNNLRQAKIVINAISSEFKLHEGKVSFCDYMILQMIKIYYPKLWNDMNHRKSEYISANMNVVENFISRKRYNVPGKEEEVDLIRKAMDYLFPYKNNSAIRNDANRMNEFKSQKRIAHDDWYDKYFI